MEQLFNREGQPKKAQTVDDKGRPVYLERKVCGRCGGAGGSDKWLHTGWTCFDCDGKGHRDQFLKHRLYTQAQLDKLNATKAKRDATRAAKAAAAAKVEEERRAVERQAVMAEFGPLVARMRGWGDPFLADLIAQVEGKVKRLSDAQIAAAETKLEKLEAEKARRQAAHFIGETGQRLELELEFVRLVSLPDYGFGESYLHIFRIPDGSTVIHKSQRFNPFELPTEWKGEGRDTWKQIVPGSKVRAKATVKEHRNNKKTGEPETFVFRPAVIAEKEVA